MFIAHLPAGYLLSRMHPWLQRYHRWLLVGAILPDIDLVYFHLIDGGMTHHHDYLTHRPLIWATLFLLPLPKGLHALALGALLHLALDSVAGQINWAWPFWHMAHPLVVVPARFDWWVLSFLSHWTFGPELAICTVALVWFWRERLR